MLPMHTDIVDLRQFYHSELGRMAEQSVSSALASIWARLPEERLLGSATRCPISSASVPIRSGPSPSCRQGRVR